MRVCVCVRARVRACICVLTYTATKKSATPEPHSTTQVLQYVSERQFRYNKFELEGPYKNQRHRNAKSLLGRDHTVPA